MIINYKYLIIIFLIIIFFIEFYINFNHLIFFFIFKNKSAIPTLPYMINKVYLISRSISLINPGKFNFIDIGCGNGDLLLNLCKTNTFRQCIGIEIDNKSYLEARKKCKNIKNLKIYNLDALNYIFEKNPTIFYLYEPFFDIQYDKAITMYHKLFNNIKKINQNNKIKNDIYIIYITGRLLFGRKDITKKMFNKYNFNIIKEEMIGSLFIKRRLYIAKFKIN